VARARKVTGIKPKGSFRDNARRVIAVRLDELLSWHEALDDPALMTELHDMRIAAKRLRYALEMFDVCFPESTGVLKDLSGLQEELGDIHDLDMLTVLLRKRLRATEAGTEAAAVAIMSENLSPRQKNSRIRQMLLAGARDERRLGLVGLIGDKLVERGRQFESLRERWAGAHLDEFALAVRLATGLAVPAPAEDGLTVEPGKPATRV
jgi:hypothetical protein